MQPAKDLTCQLYIFCVLFELKNEDGGIERNPLVTRQEFGETLILGYQDLRSLLKYPRGKDFAKPRIALA